MRKVRAAMPAALVASLAITFVLAATAIPSAAPSACAALDAGRGEGKFTGQISSVPDGGFMEVTYGSQTVVVRYGGSVIVCQGGRPTLPDALARGATVSVFGPERRNGGNIEIDAARIFVAGPPRPMNFSRPPAGGAPQAQTAIPPGVRNDYTRSAPQAQVPPPSSGNSDPDTSGRVNGASTSGQVPIVATIQRPVANSVILRGGTYQATMQQLHVVRRYNLAGLRGQPITLGAAQLDFAPILNNSKALVNVAQRLHQLPQHVQVMEEASDVSEVDEGLVVHQVLSYRILRGNVPMPMPGLSLPLPEPTVLRRHRPANGSQNSVGPGARVTDLCVDGLVNGTPEGCTRRVR